MKKFIKKFLDDIKFFFCKIKIKRLIFYYLINNIFSIFFSQEYFKNLFKIILEKYLFLNFDLIFLVSYQKYEKIYGISKYFPSFFECSFFDLVMVNFCFPFNINVYFFILFLIDILFLYYFFKKVKTINFLIDFKVICRKILVLLPNLLLVYFIYREFYFCASPEIINLLEQISDHICTNKITSFQELIKFAISKNYKKETLEIFFLVIYYIDLAIHYKYSYFWLPKFLNGLSKQAYDIISNWKN